MAHHLSAKKRIRQNEKRKLHNKYYARTTRNAVKKIRDMDNKEEASAELQNVVSLLDKLSKRNIIHKNKAANLKSKLAKQVNKM
ncbi:MAG: 30S ribosomal protein S20 [Bacteroidales bacterium]|nr:30S ribosomal protein S20 [Bacteroidales bacterium]